MSYKEVNIYAFERIMFMARIQRASSNDIYLELSNCYGIEFTAESRYEMNFFQDVVEGKETTWYEAPWVLKERFYHEFPERHVCDPNPADPLWTAWKHRECKMAAPDELDYLKSVATDTINYDFSDLMTDIHKRAEAGLLRTLSAIAGDQYNRSECLNMLCLLADQQLLTIIEDPSDKDGMQSRYLPTLKGATWVITDLNRANKAIEVKA